MPFFTIIYFMDTWLNRFSSPAEASELSQPSYFCQPKIIGSLLYDTELPRSWSSIDLCIRVQGYFLRRLLDALSPETREFHFWAKAGCPGVAPTSSLEDIRFAPVGWWMGRAGDFVLNQPREQPPSRWFQTYCLSIFFKSSTEKTIFMEDYLKKMQPVHSSRNPKIHLELWIK